MSLNGAIRVFIASVMYEADVAFDARELGLASTSGTEAAVILLT